MSVDRTARITSAHDLMRFKMPLRWRSAEGDLSTMGSDVERYVMLCEVTQYPIESSDSSHITGAAVTAYNCCLHKRSLEKLTASRGK